MMETLVVRIDMRPVLVVLEACSDRLKAADRAGQLTQGLVDEVQADAMNAVAWWSAGLPACVC